MCATVSCETTLTYSCLSAGLLASTVKGFYSEPLKGFTLLYIPRGIVIFTLAG